MADYETLSIFNELDQGRGSIAKAKFLDWFGQDEQEKQFQYGIEDIIKPLNTYLNRNKNLTIEKLFAKYDQNKNQMMSAKELAVAMKAMFDFEMTDEEVQTMHEFFRAKFRRSEVKKHEFKTILDKKSVRKYDSNSARESLKRIKAHMSKGASKDIATLLSRSKCVYPGEVMSTQEMFEKFDIKEECNQYGGCAINYELSGVSMLYFDFNNDSKLDMFGFLQNNSDGWVSGKGKFIVVEDVLNEDYKVNYYDSNNYFAVRPYLNDFNQDGKLDILLSNEDRHDNQNGGWYKPEQTPLQILYFNDDGSFTIQEIGNPTTTHDLVTGDIDNDGDIDIVNFEWVYRKFLNGSWDKEGISVPLFYINQGNGVFEIKTENFSQGDIFKQLDRWDYIATNAELFDINNDGCLDIIHAYNNQGTIEEINGEDSIVYIEVNGERIYFDRDFIILYGNCSGNFDLANSDIYNFQSPSGVNSKSGYFGCSFLDIDNDGDYDIISNENYENGVGLRVLVNNDGVFSIDDSVISPNVFLWSQGSQWDSTEFPPFGQTRLYDTDNDGDFDVFPYGINGMEVNSSAVKDKVYWENKNGNFNLIGF